MIRLVVVFCLVIVVCSCKFPAHSRHQTPYGELEVGQLQRISGVAVNHVNGRGIRLGEGVVILDDGRYWETEHKGKMVVVKGMLGHKQRAVIEGWETEQPAPYLFLRDIEEIEFFPK